MESQVKNLMVLKRDMIFAALARHISIEHERYEDAMTNQFLFYACSDKYFDIKKKLNQKETNEFLGAMFCMDYRFK